eukprot:scaffold279866_cov21-Tisochrysis_lutea.AAC.1
MAPLMPSAHSSGQRTAEGGCPSDSSRCERDDGSRTTMGQGRGPRVADRARGEAAGEEVQEE